MNLDKQRIHAVHKMEELGFEWDGTRWKGDHLPKRLGERDLDLLRSTILRYYPTAEHIERLMSEIRTWGWFR